MIRRFRNLRSGELRVIIDVVRLTTVVSILLRLRGSKTTRERMDSVSSRPSRRTSHSPDRIGELVTKVGHYMPWKPNCLERSITLAWLLRRRGHEASLRIGVQQIPGDLLFHAWIELNGVVLNDDPDVAGLYIPFPEGMESEHTQGNPLRRWG